MEEEKKKKVEDMPKESEARPIDSEPQIENEMVNKTLQKLGDYQFDKTLNDKYKDSRFLGPYVTTLF